MMELDSVSYSDRVREHTLVLRLGQAALQGSNFQ